MRVVCALVLSQTILIRRVLLQGGRITSRLRLNITVIIVITGLRLNIMLLIILITHVPIQLTLQLNDVVPMVPREGSGSTIATQLLRNGADDDDQLSAHTRHVNRSLSSTVLPRETMMCEM